MLTGTNPGVFEGALFARRASLIQRRTMLVLKPLSREIRETDAPGSWHWATIWALNSRENRRQRLAQDGITGRVWKALG
ncbi:MAG: hypothetical protein RIA11_14795 [Marinobacter salarius]|jgi:hypothetical protein|tara:strand:+ start:1757 stop:1993 length:237 start_codon:yes stop_codon:yes gene_type:complete